MDLTLVKKRNDSLQALMACVAKTALPHQSIEFIDGVATVSAIGPEPLSVEDLCTLVFTIDEDNVPADAVQRIEAAGVVEAFEQLEDDTCTAIDEESFEPCFVVDRRADDVTAPETVQWCKGFRLGLLVCLELWQMPEHKKAIEMVSLVMVMADEKLSPEEFIKQKKNGDAVWADVPRLVTGFVCDVSDYWFLQLEGDDSDDADLGAENK